MENLDFIHSFEKKKEREKLEICGTDVDNDGNS